MRAADRLAGAGKGQEVGQDPVEPGRLVGDDAQERRPVVCDGPRRVVGQHLGGGHHRAQRVADLVRQRAGQLAHGGETLALDEPRLVLGQALGHHVEAIRQAADLVLLGRADRNRLAELPLPDAIDRLTQLAERPGHAPGDHEPEPDPQGPEGGPDEEDVPGDPADRRLEVARGQPHPGDPDHLLVEHDGQGQVVDRLVPLPARVQVQRPDRTGGPAHGVGRHRLAHREPRRVGVDEDAAVAVQDHGVRHDVLAAAFGLAGRVPHDLVEAPEVVLQDEVDAQAAQVLHEVHAALAQLVVEGAPLVADHRQAHEPRHPRDDEEERAGQLRAEGPVAERPHDGALTGGGRRPAPQGGPRRSAGASPGCCRTGGR